jgi:hypothetical protein
MTKRRLTHADIAALAWPPDNERGEALAAKWENATELDPAELLGDVTSHLAAEMFRATPTQKAALSGAVIRALEAYQVLKPPTVAHYVDYLLSHPTIGPLEFVDELKRRHDELHGKRPLTYRNPPE